MLIELEKVSEIKHIIIGFNSVLTEITDKIVGIPANIMLEGGLLENELSPLGSMVYMNDEGYSNFSVKTFVKNF